MNLRMTGMNYCKTPVEIREKFSFTKSRGMELLKWIKNEHHLDGCVLVNTCNRMELWISGACKIEPTTILCEATGKSKEEYKAYFVNREGTQALRHLFKLSCGLKSMVFGEDQIIAQVKDALSLAREVRCADALLDKAFLSAISAAKKIKTNIIFRTPDHSMAERAAHTVKTNFDDIKRIEALVIGNGEMGRLAAQYLVEEGCRVCMTVRQYKQGKVVIPNGCNTIKYDDRYSYLHRCDAVISATASPHFTLTEEFFPHDRRKRVIIDLAVPRDIQPGIGRLPGIKLYNADDLNIGPLNEVAGACEAEMIIDEYIEKFLEWYYYRDLAPEIDEISRITAQDTVARLTYVLKSVKMDEKLKERLLSSMQYASKNAVSSLLYGLKDGLSRDHVKCCMDGLKTSATKQKKRIDDDRAITNQL